jgi:hypothetical protein
VLFRGAPDFARKYADAEACTDFANLGRSSVDLAAQGVGAQEAVGSGSAEFSAHLSCGHVPMRQRGASSPFARTFPMTTSEGATRVLRDLAMTTCVAHCARISIDRRFASSPQGRAPACPRRWTGQEQRVPVRPASFVHLICQKTSNTVEWVPAKDCCSVTPGTPVSGVVAPILGGNVSQCCRHASHAVFANNNR